MRKAAGLRALDLARLIGVDVATISRWETDKIAIDRATLATLGSLVRDRIAGTAATLEHLRSMEQPTVSDKKAIRLVPAESSI